jgi:hypothetical protein
MNVREDRLRDNLFTHFVDTLDMTMCCSCDISGKELNYAISKYGLYFPLIQDEARSFREHVKAMEYTSRSARFGPFIDNIVGMNWILPSGKRIKMGERVVKSTTGYDLFKFLLMADDHFGYPSDYVIRLRPSCDASYCGKFIGTRESLNGVHQELRTSSWSHWVDEMDLIISADCEPYIEVTVNCHMSEKEYFFNYFHRVASKNRSNFEETPENIIKVLPWLTIKSLPSETFNIAEDLVRNAGGVCRVLLINGVILINPANLNLAKQMIYEMKPNLENQGGHIYGNGVDKDKNGSKDIEETWVTNLVKIWEKL